MMINVFNWNIKQVLEKLANIRYVQFLTSSNIMCSYNDENIMLNIFNDAIKYLASVSLQFLSVNWRGQMLGRLKFHCSHDVIRTLY